MKLLLQMKKLKLTKEQIELLIEILSSAEIEATYASQKRHVVFLPDLFKTLTDYQKDIATLRETLILSLNEEVSDIR